MALIDQFQEMRNFNDSDLDDSNRKLEKFTARLIYIRKTCIGYRQVDHHLLYRWVSLNRRQVN